jgi:hypothetical protein
VTSIKSFCYAALLSAPDRLPALLNLLPDERSQALGQERNGLRGIPEAELRSAWAKGREEEGRQRWRDANGQIGSSFKLFSPRLQSWFLQSLY